MTNIKLPQISEEDLHAYVDGQLSEERRAQVERYLSLHPESAAEVAEWTSLNARINVLVSQADTIPVRFEKISKRNRSWFTPTSAIAAGIALFLLGAIGGSGTVRFLNSANADRHLATLSATSQTNFLVYASDIRHPIEVGAEQKDHMVAWLSKRLGEKIAAPDITKEGFSLIGGRLVTYSDQPAALIMYENTKGERLTLMIAHNAENQVTGFQFNDRSNIQTLYWIDGSLGYALSSSIGKDRLESVAHLLNTQL